jgi:hypothetical protein
LGVVVKTRVQTPRRWGDPFSAAVRTFADFDSRPLRTSWAIVGTRDPREKFASGRNDWNRQTGFGRLVSAELARRANAQQANG